MAVLRDAMTRWDSWTFFLLLQTTTWLCGCISEPLTEVVVIVEQDSKLGADAIEGTVTNPDDPTRPQFEISPAPWNDDGKYIIALSPRDSQEPGRYHVEVGARKNGQAVATARLISGYLVGQTRYVRLLLDGSCRTSCDKQTTCRAGACVSAQAAASGFGKNIEGAPESTRAPQSDGPDNGSNGDGDDEPRDEGETVRKKDAGYPKKDAGKKDAGTDADNSDNDTSDAGRTDAGRSDAGASDAGRTDAGRSDAGASVACSNLTYAVFGKNFIDSYCAVCHNSASAANGTVVLNSLANIVARKEAVKTAVLTRRMPPAGPVAAPSETERERFRAFIDCGPK